MSCEKKTFFKIKNSKVSFEVTIIIQDLLEALILLNCKADIVSEWNYKSVIYELDTTHLIS